MMYFKFFVKINLKLKYKIEHKFYNIVYWLDI